MSYKKYIDNQIVMGNRNWVTGYKPIRLYINIFVCKKQSIYSYSSYFIYN